jgi:energy-coupling factor transporter transmembrane protein EcfT
MFGGNSNSDSVIRIMMTIMVVMIKMVMVAVIVMVAMIIMVIMTVAVGRAAKYSGRKVLKLTEKNGGGGKKC